MMSATDSLLPFDPGHVPPALRAIPRWAPWRAQENEKRGKVDKVPFRWDAPKYGISTRKPATWGTFEQALKAMHSDVAFRGLGFCLTGWRGVSGFDLDGCLEDDGSLKAWAAEIVAACNSYTERSPSGRGIRVVMQCTFDRDWQNHEVGVEFYAGNSPRFLTITGQHIAGTPDDLRAVDPSVIENFAARYAKAREAAEVVEITSMPDELDELALHDIRDLGLPERALTFLLKGPAEGDDRSALLAGAAVALYAAGLCDAEVYTQLVRNEHALGVALAHRRQDHDRALTYLWIHHCLPAKRRVADGVAKPEEFDVVDDAPAVPATPGGPVTRPRYRRRPKTGMILPVLPNLLLALRSQTEIGVTLGFDEFRGELMIAARPGEWRPFRDTDYTVLQDRLENRDFEPIKHDLFRRAIALVGWENKFDSAILWARTLVWDGTPRVDRFLTTHFNAPDTPYARAVAAYLWTGLASRVLDPGCQADMMPIFVGGQGLVKSGAIAAMVPGRMFFCELGFNKPEDDLARLMRGKLIAEVAELKGLHSKDAESIKAWVVRREESWVPKYVEFATTYPRRLILVGTSNEDTFLDDPTGNRRWLPLKVGRVDIAAIERDREQLWAEAITRWDLVGQEWQAAERLAKAEHDEFSMRDVWHDAIAEWLDTPDLLTGEAPRTRNFLRIDEVAHGALAIPTRGLSRREEMRIGKTLTQLGLIRHQMRVLGKTTRVYLTQLGAPRLGVPTS